MLEKMIMVPNSSLLLVLSSTGETIYNMLELEKTLVDESKMKKNLILNKKFSDKGKSARDHLTDPKLSSQPAIELPGLANNKRKEDHSSDWESDDEVETLTSRN
ncbi:hypothetical protein WN48_08801 [Eufriesea mexicana]|uniref:Peptidyl-prolyl cis-trans isomerase CWC27 like protein n=1 Tax=Eufriesea mexicana TaxID=516756 RepID=A0A310SA75_9HYME|nr:hypothetical protein WN48_08801 [Eufriesea mexicana]